MTVQITYIDTPILEMNEYGEFECPHYNTEIEEPCCSGYDNEGNISCGCMGQTNTYCRDCKDWIE